MASAVAEAGGDNYWGAAPDEDTYHAAQGVRGTRGYYTAPSGLRLFTRSWEPAGSPPRAVVCMVHGYGNDTSWTFQATPIFLARAGFACFALDLPGHGRSDGLRAFVPDLSSVLRDCTAFFHHSVAARSFHGLPRFLYGESMGGAICLLIHLRDPRPEAWRGAVLVAPMCRISDRIRPPWPLPHLLTFFARFLPTLPLVPTADLIDKSVKVPEKRAVATRNPMRYNGRPRLGTVLELLRVTDDLAARLAEVSLPFIVLHGSADVVTDPDVSRALHGAARSGDKTILVYDGMMHSLLFGETDEDVDTVRNDILRWLNERCTGPEEPKHQTKDIRLPPPSLPS